MTVGPVVVGIDGLELSAEDRDRLAHPLVGMVILFSRNFESPEQLCRLTAAIHALRDPPLLIAVDHEGGRVQRFRNGFTRLPAMRRLGELWDRDVLQACRVAASFGYVLASELRAHGVDLSFTPVLDLDWGRSGVIGDRALPLGPSGRRHAGGTPDATGWRWPAWPTAASISPATAGPRPIRTSPFRTTSAAGPRSWRAMPPRIAGSVRSSRRVMPAHVIYDRVDAAPAGFSSRWLRILRGEFGFAGAAFTDDLLMEGASTQGTVVERARAGLRAGCDLVLVCSDTTAMDAVLSGLRWRRPRTFDERYGRLRPRGAAAGIGGLQLTELYRQARADLEALTA